MKRHIQKLLIGLLAIFLISCTAQDTRPSKPTSELPAQTKQCGDIKSASCGADEYCKKNIGACNTANTLGTCTAKTPFCTREYRPVCGCDGKTYGNQCTAGAAGVSIDYIGQCK